MRIIVDKTGPDHEPTTETKWYAQVVLTSWDLLPIGVKTFQFGPTPEKALESLLNDLRGHSISVG